MNADTPLIHRSHINASVCSSLVTPVNEKRRAGWKQLSVLLKQANSNARAADITRKAPHVAVAVYHAPIIDSSRASEQQPWWWYVDHDRYHQILQTDS